MWQPNKAVNTKNVSTKNQHREMRNRNVNQLRTFLRKFPKQEDWGHPHKLISSQKQEDAIAAKCLEAMDKPKFDPTKYLGHGAPLRISFESALRTFFFYLPEETKKDRNAILYEELVLYIPRVLEPGMVP